MRYRYVCIGLMLTTVGALTALRFTATMAASLANDATASASTPARSFGKSPTGSHGLTRADSPLSQPTAAVRQGMAVDPGPAADRMPVKRPKKTQADDRMVHDPSTIGTGAP